MDPHFTRKPPSSPPSLSGATGSGSASGNNGGVGVGGVGSNGSGGISSVFMDDSLLASHKNLLGEKYQNHSAAAVEQQKETEDQLQLAIKNTLACVRVLLKQPRSSDLVRGFINDSMAPPNTTANSSNLIELRTLEAHLPSASIIAIDSSNVTSTFGQHQQSDHQQQIISQANETTATATRVVDMLSLYDRLPASTSSLPLDALSHEWQVLLVVIYSLTAITSFLLNMITLVVLSRCQRTELRKYLINLSLSDLLMSMFSIQYMLGHWLFGAFLCPFIRFVVTLSVFVSIATMTVIGINRHLAIMYPLKRKNNSKWKHWTTWNKTHVIVGIWVLGTAISLPEYLAFAELPFCYNNLLYYECRNTWPDEIANPYTIFIFLSTFAIPLALLSYLYTSIGLKLWRRQMPGNVDVNRDLTMQTKRAKVVKMLLVVVVLFAVMWLPLQTFSMVNFLYPDIRGNTEYASLGYNIFVGTYFACHWLGMAHSCVSPLVYCFMNKKFRTDLRNLLCPLRALVGGPQGHHNGLSGLGKGTLFESYNSTNATFRTSGHYHNHNLPPHLQGSAHLRSSNPHSMNSNSVRVRSNQSISRQLSKTNSLSSLRTTSKLGPQTSNELSRPSATVEDESSSKLLHTMSEPLKQVVATAQMSAGPQPEQVVGNLVAQTADILLVGAEKHDNDHKQVAPSPGSSEETTKQANTNQNPQVQGSTVVKIKNSLFERQVLMSKLSETSATETLHEIDEESEEEEEEEEEEELNGETGSGRMVTIRHHKCDYAILEPTTAKNTSTPSNDGVGDEQAANV